MATPLTTLTYPPAPPGCERQPAQRGRAPRSQANGGPSREDLHQRPRVCPPRPPLHGGRRGQLVVPQRGPRGVHGASEQGSQVSSALEGVDSGSRGANGGSFGGGDGGTSFCLTRCNSSSRSVRPLHLGTPVFVVCRPALVSRYCCCSCMCGHFVFKSLKNEAPRGRMSTDVYVLSKHLSCTPATGVTRLRLRLRLTCVVSSLHISIASITTMNGREQRASPSCTYMYHSAVLGDSDA